MAELFGGLAERWLELLAVGFGLVSVWLSAHEDIWSWPTAIVNVGIFFFIFWEEKLYADSVLQLFYLGMSVYGWWAWLHGGANRSALHVTRATARQWGAVLPLMLGCGLALGWYLDNHTDSPVPYMDALLTTTSLGAQWMMARKILENWIVWIVADIVYVPLFISRGLPWTAVQYAVFLGLAWMGYRAWKQSLLAPAQGLGRQGGGPQAA
ncbi:MAG: nicotinamide mononucleotide transporter [Gemmatimonadetes bacterium]|nr:nicotinamide mononucleotide transporter [Gemmatimonadota bacterium]